jgi:hypothetical protein
LNEAGGQLTEQPALTFDDQVVYTALPSGATVLFADGRLHSIQLAPRV